jgi:hypothetical protein
MKALVFCFMAVAGILFLSFSCSDVSAKNRGGNTHFEWDSIPLPVMPAPIQNKSSVPVFHCGGVTTKGTPCRIVVSNDGERCRFHSPGTPRCGAPTSTGTPCKRTVAHAGEHCYQHQ